MLFNEYGVWQWTANEKVPPEESPNSVASSATESASDCTQTSAADGGESAGSASPPNEVDASTRSPAAEDGHWALQPSATEEEIFQLLKIAYVQPTDRIGPGNWNVNKKKWNPRKSQDLEPVDTPDELTQ